MKLATFLLSVAGGITLGSTSFHQEVLTSNLTRITFPPKRPTTLNTFVYINVYNCFETSVHSRGLRALLETIQIAEGTLHKDSKEDEPYRTVFGGMVLPLTGEVYNDHPRILRHGWSDAAGAYQFLSTTWDEMSTGDFSPKSQDATALHLIKSTLTPAEFQRVELEGELTPVAIYKLARHWASLPGPNGHSLYNQTAKSEDEVFQIYSTQKKQNSSPSPCTSQ